MENVKKGGFSHVFVGHSAFGKTVLPRAAALLDTQQISDIIEIQSEDSTWFLIAVLKGNADMILQHSCDQSTLETSSSQCRAPTTSNASQYERQAFKLARHQVARQV